MNEQQPMFFFKQPRPTNQYQFVQILLMLTLGTSEGKELMVSSRVLAAGNRVRSWLRMACGSIRTSSASCKSRKTLDTLGSYCPELKLAAVWWGDESSCKHAMWSMSEEATTVRMRSGCDSISCSENDAMRMNIWSTAGLHAQGGCPW